MRISLHRWVGGITSLTTLIAISTVFMVRGRGTFAVLHRSGLYGTDWIGPWWYVLLVPVFSMAVAIFGSMESPNHALKRIRVVLLTAVESVLLVASICILVWNL